MRIGFDETVGLRLGFDFSFDVAFAIDYLKMTVLDMTRHDKA